MGPELALDLSYFQSDGIHPSIEGAHLYSATVRDALAELSERHTGTTVRLEELPVP